MPADVAFDVNILSSIRGLTAVVTDAGGLNVAVDEFSYELSGATVTFAAVASQAVAANALNYVFLDAAGVLTVNQSGYPSDGTKLARVEAGASTLNNIIVDRAAIEVASIYTDLPLYSPLSVPPAPIGGRLRLYGRERHGRGYLDVQGSGGRDYPLQPFLGTNSIRTHTPNTTTTIQIYGMPVTSVGTVSTPTLASTNFSTQFRRWRLTSAATSNSAAENRSAITHVWRGNAAGLGGFTFITRINLSTLPANHRGFFGLTSSTGAISTTQSPIALTNCLGFAYESGETNWRFQHNDSSGSATRVDLGANFPTNSTTAVFTMFVYSALNGSEIGYRLVREETGDIVDGSVNTDLPSNTTFMTYHNYMNNGGTAAACSFDCGGVYIETDY